MKMKIIMMALMFGTSALAQNANKDYNKSNDGDRDHAPVWKDHQSAPSRGSDSPEDGRVATYSAVPEAREIVAAAMLLLPLGAGTIRGLRRKKNFSGRIG